MSIEIELRKLVINCQECNKQFIKVLKNQKFCCDNCRKKNYGKMKRRAKIVGRDLFAA